MPVVSSTPSLTRIYQPREKILKLGPSALSTDELIAVIINTGSRGTTVQTLARRVARLLKGKDSVTLEDLMKLGLGRFKSAQILAAFELAHRVEPNTIRTVTKPEQVYALSQEIIRDDRESILCLYLNARGELLLREVLAIGSLNRANLLPREIFVHIKDLPVASIILAHNHPSGDLTPSHDDILFTRRVKKSAEIIGITLLDHLVVGREGWKRVEA